MDLDEAATTPRSFQDTFDPLARHFFPDGCPLPASSELDIGDVAVEDNHNLATIGQPSHDEVHSYLKHVWPQHRGGRTAVSAASALDALNDLNAYAIQHGLSPAELVAVAVVATATIPSTVTTTMTTAQHCRTHMNRGRPMTAVNSPLRDGGSRHFCTLVHCLLPALSQQSRTNNNPMVCDNDTVAGAAPHAASAFARALSLVTDRLMSTCCRYTQYHHHNHTTSTASEGDVDCMNAKRCVLRFVLLAVVAMEERTSTTTFPFRLRRLPRTLVYQWCLQPSTCIDAARLVWLLQSSSSVESVITTVRLRQFRAVLLAQQHLSTTTKWTTAALTCLSDIVDRFGKTPAASCHQPRKKSNSTTVGETTTVDLHEQQHSWLAFPEEQWESEFEGRFRSKRDTTGLVVSDGTNHHNPRTDEDSMELWVHHPDINRRKSSKRLRRSCAAMQAVCTHVRTRRVGSSSSASWMATATATDLLGDEYLQHLFSLSLSSSSSAVEHDYSVDTEDGNAALDSAMERSKDKSEIARVWTRFCKILPVKLHTEWSSLQHATWRNAEQGPCIPLAIDTPSKTESADMASTLQATLICTMADHAQCIGFLPTEAADFIVRRVLPSWDGNSHNAMGKVLLQRILPWILPPVRTHTFGSLAELVHRCSAISCSYLGHLFYHLERLFLYGDRHLQYSIVAGTLSTLVSRWSYCSWPHNDTKELMEDHDDWKMQMLCQVCHWTDDLLLKGFLAVRNENELLRAAVLRFYNTICTVVENLGLENKRIHELVTEAAPSPMLMYTLLMSSSAVHIDGVCLLMVRLKAIFQSVKEADPQSAAIRVYNCLVWDFCSFLWRCTPPPPPTNSKIDHCLDDVEESSARLFSILYTDLSPNILGALHNSYDCTRSRSISSALSITHGAAFRGYASRFLTKYNGGSELYRSSDLIQGELKFHYLDYLNDNGLNGIFTFLSTFVESLVARNFQASNRTG